MEDKDRWSILSSVLLTVIASLCALTLLLRVDRVSLIESPRFTTGCGDWQQAYTKLHRQITSSRKQAKRLCVATTREEKGLYDRLTGSHHDPPHPACGSGHPIATAHARLISVADSAHAVRSAALHRGYVR